MTFLAIVVCQVGTGLAARTERASLFSVGVLSNRLLLYGFAFELAVAAGIVYVGPLQSMFGTAPVGALDLFAPRTVPARRLGRGRAQAVPRTAPRVAVRPSVFPRPGFSARPDAPSNQAEPWSRCGCLHVLHRPAPTRAE